MRAARVSLFALVLLLAAVDLTASGLVQFYAIVERVVFEPSERVRDRVQVWGAFMIVDGSVWGSGATSKPQRGYLYFKLPKQDSDVIKREWDDLKGVAGTGQVVAFGGWGYIGRFLDVADGTGGYIIGMDGKPIKEVLRIRKQSDAPANPDEYRTDTGVMKLPEQGNLANIVKQLKEALK